MNFNLRTKDEEKKHFGLQLYVSDHDKIYEIASNNGVTASLLIRSIINDFLDSQK